MQESPAGRILWEVFGAVFPLLFGGAALLLYNYSLQPAWGWVCSGVLTPPAVLMAVGAFLEPGGKPASAAFVIPLVVFMVLGSVIFTAASLPSSAFGSGHQPHSSVLGWLSLAVFIGSTYQCWRCYRRQPSVAGTP